MRELDQRYVYLDLKQTQSLLDLPGGVTVIDLTVRRHLRRAGRSRAHRAFTGLKAESWMETNAQLMNALRSQSLSTGMISFFVALSRGLRHRQRAVDQRRAAHARDRHPARDGHAARQMLKVFLVQGAVLGFSRLGRSAARRGYGLVWVFNTFGPKLFYIPVAPALVPMAMAIATLPASLPAAVPARRAARLDPVVAIRHV